MPRPRKSTSSSNGNSNSVSASSSSVVTLPSNGNANDIARLSSVLGLTTDVVTSIMTCQGMGVRSSRSNTTNNTTNAAGDGDAAGMAAMSSVWGDWMNEEMTMTSSNNNNTAAVDNNANVKSEPAPTATSTATSSTEPRSYTTLPLAPSSFSNHPPGILLQTGTLDSSIPGRSHLPKQPRAIDLDCPTVLYPSSALKNVKFIKIISNPTACHSVAISQDGKAYGWGRNENGQLGLGYTSGCVPVPTLLSVGDVNDDGSSIVSAGVGKYHTLLVTKSGTVYGSGGNKCGQLGVNNEKLDMCDKFRKCVVEYSDEDETIVHASCGENISALLSSKGNLYTAGSSEWGQLANGETGEYIISAGKLGYANCTKFLRRSVFVEADNNNESNKTDGNGRVKCVPLPNTNSIKLATVSCGRNHLIAIEAPSARNEVPRVFTWGCGDYGCLGHVIQADEYLPRMISSFTGPLFANNHPVECVAGSNCSVIRTKNGHVYYMGKHRSVGEATMRPTLIDALANNGHVVTCIGAGSMTVFCSTANGVTVSWGNGAHGELGYGKGENKSSSKPKFVNGLDSCMVTSLACGMGHTLFLVQDKDGDDKEAIKKIPKLDESDASDVIEQLKSKRGSGGGDQDGPPKKKAKGRPKKG